MMLKFARLARRNHLIRALCLQLLVLLPASAPALRADDAWPLSVRVHYAVEINGFDVGSFEYESQAEQQSYSLSGSAHLSILLGAFTWEGQTRSSGTIVGGLKPASFAFDYKSSLKAGSTSFAFANDTVTSITQQPPPIFSPEAIPLREDHLKGVIDPLTALMLLSRGSANPCQRRIPIFDGRERFDLLFSYKGEVRVSELMASGQPSIAMLCKVRYLPIAGHKVDADTQFMAANEGIEVALRPIPTANLFVPYSITIPTRVGIASLQSKRVDIVTPGKPQIALLH
jgi:Protein of unknown function (DUF3108)